MKLGSIFILVLLLTACTSKNIEENKNQHSPYMNLSTEAPTEEEKGMMDEDVQTNNTKLPFKDFSQRWNALSEQQLSNLYIRGLEKESSGSFSYYRAELTALNEMRIFVSEDYVQKIELISEAPKKDDVLRMLSAWSQIINILHPEIEFIDADSFFHEIGVGPDGDLSNLKETSLSYDQLYFQINRTEKGYHFSASYQDRT